MKLQEARQLIKRTFENPFNKEHFTYFISNLLKDEYEEKPFTQTGAHLPDAFAAYIRKMERIGKYEDETGNIIDILLVELKKDHSVEWARTTQRNFIRRYLNGSRGGELKDAAIVAFYTEDSEDWRFSLIKMQYSLEKKKDELTPAKRFSFLVGKNEKSHTAQKQLTGLLTMDTVPTLADIESSFNIETVTREFFEKYKELFLSLHDFFEKQFEKNRELRKELQAKHIDHISFTKKLLGQIVFLYFLQKKGWLGVPKNGKWGEGDKRFLRSLLEKATSSKKIFYTDYLQYLFYEALAEESRNAADPSYYRLLDCKIPFLNGGLFEADYDWKSINVKIPNDYFTNENITKEGDTGNGILDVFDRYNFTVKEDEPLEKEVAVDPEMLGKVFENLLEVTDRKSKGAFYTPREIVHYMCQESLINYLDTTLNNNPVSYQKLGTEQTDMFGNKIRKGQLPLEVEHGTVEKVPKKDLEKFIREGTAAIDNDARVEKAGKETDRYSYQLPEAIRNYATDIDRALADIRVCDPAIGSGAFPVGIMNEIVKAREILTTYLPANKQKDRTAYELKRHCIQECIYGVDIDHSAIDIAKLRLWLSLIVDEEDFYKIKPLPNLDYKIVEGNSLIGMPEGSFRDVQLEDEIQELKEQLFDETNKVQKDKLREKISQKIRKLLDSAEQFAGYKIDFDFKLFFSEVFHEKKGFDVVIGNPPYGVSFTKSEKEYLKIIYSAVHVRTPESFNYFVFKFSELTNKYGSDWLIIPSSFLTQTEFEKSRKLILNSHSLSNIINLGDGVFDGVTAPTCIIGFKKRKVESDIIYADIREIAKNDLRAILKNVSKVLDANSFVENQSLNFVFNPYKLLLNKCYEDTPTMKDICDDVATGVSSGLDKAYVYTQKEIKEKKIEGALLKKIIIGGEILKYYINPISTKKIIYITDEDKINDYPGIKNELLKHKAALSKRREAANGKINWYSLNWPRRKKLFESPKILIRQTANRIIAAFDKEGWYCLKSGLIVQLPENSNIKYKYLVSLLNSSLMNFLYHFLVNEDNRIFPEVKPIQLFKLPIKEANIKKQEALINLVEKIYKAKKVDPSTSTGKWEKQIDIMVYYLYNLTYEEAKIIDPELSEDEFAKHKI